MQWLPAGQNWENRAPQLLQGGELICFLHLSHATAEGVRRRWTISTDGFMGLLLERPEPKQSWFFSCQSRHHGKKHHDLWAFNKKKNKYIVYIVIWPTSGEGWWRFYNKINMLYYFTKQDCGNIALGFPFFWAPLWGEVVLLRLKHDQRLKEPND